MVLTAQIISRSKLQTIAEIQKLPDTTTCQSRLVDVATQRADAAARRAALGLEARNLTGLASVEKCPIPLRDRES